MVQLDGGGMEVQAGGSSGGGRDPVQAIPGDRQLELGQMHPHLMAESLEHGRLHQRPLASPFKDLRLGPIEPG
jgi:hypothetical protein